MKKNCKKTSSSFTGHLLLALWVAAAIRFVLWPGPVEAGENYSGQTKIQKVLMIHSMTVGYSRYFDYSDGFIQTMNNSAYPIELTNLELRAPMTQKGRVDNQNRLRSLLEPYMTSLAAGEYDVLIGIGDAAFCAIREKAKQIAPTTVIGFIALPQKENINFQQRPNVFGSVARNHEVETLDLARKLFPERKNVILISDNTILGKNVERKIRKKLDGTDMILTVFRADDMSEKDMLEKLGQYTGSGFVIYHEWNDSVMLETLNGLSNYIKVVCNAVNKHRIPFFVMRQMMIQHGVLGGVVWRGFDCGRETAENVISMLEGNNIRKPEFKNVNTVTTINWPMVARYHVNSSSIPDNAVYLNKPDDFLTNYRLSIFWTAVGLILFFILLVTSVIILWRNARTAARDNAIFTKMPIRFFVIARNEKFLLSRLGTDDKDKTYGATSVKELGLPQYEEISAAINSVFTTGEMRTADFELNGQKRTAFCYKLPYSLYNQETVLWISQDTTELQNARETAQRNAAQFKLTLNSIGDAVIVTDTNAQITMMNPVAEQLTGWHTQEAVGKHVDEIISLKSYVDDTPVEVPIKRVLATGKNVELANHTDMVAKDGSRRHIADSAAPITDGQGVITGVVMVVRDVTGEYEKRDMIQHQNRQMKRASEIANMTYFTCPFKIPFEMGDAISSDFWGHDANGKAVPVTEWICKDDLLRFENAIHIAAIDNDRDGSVEYRAKRGDKIHYFNMKISVNHDADNGKREFFGIIRDVTVEKEQKLQLQDAVEAARSADRAKSYFLSTMSHEIRTPLNAVVGFAEMLQEKDISEKEREEFLNAIKFAGNALLTLVNGVLDLSKLDAGKMKISKSRTDMSLLLTETLTIFKQKALEKDLFLTLNGAEKLPYMVVDHARIRQILLNLLGNAMKFTHSGGVTVDTRFNRESSDIGTFVFSVADTGIGISDKFKKKLFLPFTQQDAIRGGNRKYEGTGLGLSICKKLLEAMDGEVSVDSVEGKGSSFTVVLREVKYQEKTPEAQMDDLINHPEKAIAREEKGSTRYRVLVVDDQPANLMLLNSLLRRKGLKVISVESGKEALQLLDEREFDLVLTDLWMPEMNGMELAAKIRERLKNTDLKIFAITADVDADANFKLDLFNGIMLKPLSGARVQKLLTILEEAKGANPLQTGHMLINELLK